MRWAHVACMVWCGAALGCEDARPGGDPASTSGADTAANATTNATTSSAEPANTDGARTAKDPAPVERLEVETLHLTIEVGGRPEERHGLRIAPPARWSWTADDYRNMINYHSGADDSGGLLALTLNMNEPGEKLTLGKYGDGRQAEMAMMFSSTPGDPKSKYELQALSGWIEARRDTKSGAMIGTFEGVFLNEPMFKPLIVEEEHMGVEMKVSGSFAIQPPPRRAYPIDRVQPVMPTIP